MSSTENTILPVWDLQSDGITYISDIIGKIKDIRKKYIVPHKSFYDKKIKITANQSGIILFNKVIKFKKLKLNTIAELKTMKFAMLHSIICEIFNNDCMTFYMLERGLINKERNRLTPKGQELRNLWLNSLD